MAETIRSSIPARGSGTIGALARLDRDIGKAATKSAALRFLVYGVGVIMLGLLFALVMAADAGSSRVSTAAFMSAIILGFMGLSPLIASAETGLTPEHVRTLAVSSAQLRAALTRRVLRTLIVWVIASSLSFVALATSSASAGALIANAIGVVLLAVLVDLAPRLVALRFAAIMRSQAGKIVGTLGGVSALALVYVAFLLISNSVIDPNNAVLKIVVRVLPSGWPAVAGENIDNGYWWLAILAIIGLVALIGVVYVDWARCLNSAMYATMSPATRQSSDAAERRSISSSPLVVAVGTEARMMVRDPQRLGLAIMPLVFVVIGVVLAIVGTDVYGMAYGAPLALFLSGSVMNNSYGLDRWGFANLVISPAAARLVVASRMILVAGIGLIVGVLGTVIGRVVGTHGIDTLPIAVAIIVGGVSAIAAIAAIMPALAPYRVPQGAGMSSINSRGSMSGKSFGYTVLAMISFGIIVAPGAILGAVLDGVTAYLAVVVAAAIAVPVLVVAYRRGVRLIALRGPEILNTVTATS